MMQRGSPRRLAMMFDEGAADYDRHRWSYPGELVDRACEEAGIGPGARVLEVGCGTGQLTHSLVARGLAVTALDPGRRLLALAERKLEDIEFVNARFEDAELCDERFAAVFSASAFHWVDPDVGWRRAARILVPGGTLALIQYCGLEDPRSRPDQEALLGALASVAPELAARWPRPRDLESIIAGIAERANNVSEVWRWVGGQDVARGYAARLFSDVQVATVTRVVEHTADQLNALIGTISFVRAMPAAQRTALERQHHEIHRRLGRPIRSSVVYVLVTAKRTAT